MLGRVIFGSDDDFQKHLALGVFPTLIRMQRQVSYFGDQDGLHGLMKVVNHEERYGEVLQILWEDRHEDYIPYKPFVDWPEVEDTEFKDLIQ